jgi:polyhydroxybutyrate depolymerase
MSDVFAAIGSDVGPIATNLAPKCNPSKPISVVAIQGTADSFIPINGGDTKHKGFGIGDGGLVESAENTMNLWASKNSCSASRKERLPVLVDDGTAVDKTTYSGCRDNAEVVYYIVNGMGHGWPPKKGQVTQISGPASGNIYATKVFWEFFKNHPEETKNRSR